MKEGKKIEKHARSLISNSDLQEALSRVLRTLIYRCDPQKKEARGNPLEAGNRLSVSERMKETKL